MNNSHKHKTFNQVGGLVDIRDISLPEVYKQSADFRFFCKWFAESLQKIKYDTDNISDLYDPIKCPSDCLWALADTMGYTFDDRLNLPVSFNRLVLIYFMSMIYHRGSKDGVTLSAEVNLAQFNLMNKAKDNDVLYDRLEDTSLPSNAVTVVSHTEYGYIDVVYYSTELPTDACIEYTRPLGMFLFQHAGVKFSAKSKISVDARLTDLRDINHTPTYVGDSWITQLAHYRRADYASLQGGGDSADPPYSNELRQDVWYRNSAYEDTTNENISPGLRSLYTLQFSNNEAVVRSLLPPLFSLGYEPQTVDTVFPDAYVDDPDVHGTDYLHYPSDNDRNKPYNLRYDSDSDDKLESDSKLYIETVDKVVSADSDHSVLHPYPAVNPVMANPGDAISKKDDNTEYFPSIVTNTETEESGD